MQGLAKLSGMKIRVSFFALVSFFFVSVLHSAAQDQTTGRNRVNGPAKEASVVLVPYEPKMYISDVTRELCLSNELDTDELRRILREGLSQLVAVELGNHARVADLLNDGEEEQLKDLHEIYSAITYDFIKVPLPDTVKTKDKNPDQTGRGAVVEGGQLKTYYDGKERFMDARIVDKRILSYLQKQYDPDYLVFLNELDIRVLRTGPAAHSDRLPRQIKVHFTILDIKGKKVFGSAIMMDYPYGESDVFKIVRSYFPVVGKGIADVLFPPVAAPSALSTGRN